MLYRDRVHGWEERRVGVTHHALFGKEVGSGGHAIVALFGSEIKTAEVEGIDGVRDVEEFLEFADGVGGEGRSNGAGGRIVELELNGGVQGDGREEGD